jgi:hypothetical protein
MTASYTAANPTHGRAEVEVEVEATYALFQTYV